MEVATALDIFRRKKTAYSLCFSTPVGNEVLIDLASFCRAVESCVVAEKGKPVDRERTLILEGRREVFLRITNQMNLSTEQLYALATGRNILQPAQDE